MIKNLLCCLERYRISGFQYQNSLSMVLTTISLNSESQNIENRNSNIEMVFGHSKLCIKNSFDNENVIFEYVLDAKVGF